MSTNDVELASTHRCASSDNLFWMHSIDGINSTDPTIFGEAPVNSLKQATLVLHNFNKYRQKPINDFYLNFAEAKLLARALEFTLGELCLRSSIDMQNTNA